MVADQSNYAHIGRPMPGRPAHIPADQWFTMSPEEREAMGEWETKMGRDMHADPLENKTESFTLKAPVPSITERAAVLMSMLYGLTSVSNARPNMHIEWSGGSDDPVIIRQTDGWTMTLDMWSVHLFPNKSEVVVNHDGEELTFQPMDALVHLGHIICKY